jgi:hypothetical protein
VIIDDDDCDSSIRVFHSQKLHVNIFFLSLKYACSLVRLDTATYRYCCDHACKNRAALGVFSVCAELMECLVFESQAHSLPISSVPPPPDFKKSLAYSAVRNGLYFQARTCSWSDNKYTGRCLLCLSLDKPCFPGRRLMH